MKLPEHVSPAAARRRALLVDVLIAGSIATFAIVAAAGLGVVGVAALLTLPALLVWGGVEALLRRRTAHRLAVANLRPRATER